MSTAVSVNSTTSTNPGAFLESEPVGKLLLRFSVPCVLSMLVSALYNIVDQVFIGQGVGYLGNAATNVVYPFTVFALAVSLLIGDGAAALFSLSMGRNEPEAAQRSAGNGLVLLLVASALLTVLGFVFRDSILSLFGVTEACRLYAQEYMSVILVGIPFYMITSGVNGLIRADGAPKYAMVSTSVGALINLICDPIAIFVFGWGVAGAAWATVLGQVVTCLLSLLYFRRPRMFRLTKQSFLFLFSAEHKIVQLGLPSFIIQIAIVIVMGVANSLIVKYGPQSVFGADIPLSVVGIVMKVFAIVVAFAVGISVGGQPIIGYNRGAGNHHRVFAVYRLILLVNTAIGCISMLVFEFCPQWIIALFGSESDLYNQYATICFRVFLGGILFCCIQKASCIFLQSIGRPLQATLLSLSRDVFFFVPALLILAPAWGVTGMLWAAPISDVLSFLLTLALIFSEYRRISTTDTLCVAQEAV